MLIQVRITIIRDSEHSVEFLDRSSGFGVRHCRERSPHMADCIEGYVYAIDLASRVCIPHDAWIRARYECQLVERASYSLQVTHVWTDQSRICLWLT